MRERINQRSGNALTILIVFHLIIPEYKYMFPGSFVWPEEELKNFPEFERVLKMLYSLRRLSLFHILVDAGLNDDFLFESQMTDFGDLTEILQNNHIPQTDCSLISEYLEDIEEIAY